MKTITLRSLRRLSLNGTLMQFYTAGLAENLRLMELTPTIAAKTNELGGGFSRRSL